MITVGMDLGTQKIKVVILKDNVVASRSEAFSGFDPTKAAEQAIEEALKQAGIKISDVANIVATGSNMDMAPYARSTVSMMGADAKAGCYLIPVGKNDN